MPAYLLVFSYVFLTNVFTYGRFFYMDIPKTRLLLTLIGMDGYVQWVKPTYFVTGEWFLGAILVAYAYYPLMRLLQQKAKFVTLVVLVIICIYLSRMTFLGLPYFTNPFVCLLCFYAGMLLAEYSQRAEKKYVKIFTYTVSVVLVFVPCLLDEDSVAVNELLIETAKNITLGISLMIILKYWGERISANKAIYRCVRFVGDLSYYTFLIHHSIIYKVLEGFNPASTKSSVGILCVIIAITLLLAKILDIVMRAFFKNSTFMKVERFLLKGFRKESKEGD